MRKVIIILLSIIFFIFSYQVRLGFLNTHDYSEPSDAGEYVGAATARVPFPFFNKNAVKALNVHGVPTYNYYSTSLSFFGLIPQKIAPISNSFFTVLLFLTSLSFLPLSISIILGVVASIYTPLFAAIYSWMPENFTTIIIPTLVILASFLIVRAKDAKTHLLAGIILALIGFSRNVFLFYGILFIAIYLLLFRNLKKKNVFALALGYIVPVLLWLILVQIDNAFPYTPGSFESAVYYANNLKTDGWTLDAVKVSWLEIIKNTILQNPISLILLRLERIVRFFQNPANAYSSSFPFSTQENLIAFHFFILFFAAWGIRGIFKNKTLFFIFSAILWNIFFITSTYLEEIRLQAPTIGLVLLFAAVGINEYLKLLQSKYAKIPIIIITSIFLIWFFLRSHILGLELELFSFIKDAGIWRAVNILGAAFLMFYASRKLWEDDHKNLRSLVPFFIFILVLASHLRSEIWHQWKAPLLFGQYAEQTIDLTKTQAEEIKKLKGYLLIDMQDVNSGKFLSVKLNDNILKEQLPMNKMRSPVDLMAIRQWQRQLPRLGWGHVEEEIASASAWPNMHQWLVFPLDGDILKDKNTIIIKNTNHFSSIPPVIFGDYLSSGDEKRYEGPDARIFQGYMHFNKYQIDQDFRLNGKLSLLSISNTSKFYLIDEAVLADDLSLVFGKQTGRYRIFFLFPYRSGDPESIF